MDDLAKLLVYSFLVGFSVGLSGPGAVMLIVSSLRKMLNFLEGGD